ncbi:unnamed protein product [Arabis nemorensis]|uniref:Uncharacterized protein n=1 Tax=Arabis nemorensis TaxID=586526 RepID=A0A565BCT8_9BRAS|nr:unnamed protein product [Arabis nemorensis]
MVSREGEPPYSAVREKEEERAMLGFTRKSFCLRLVDLKVEIVGNSELNNEKWAYGPANKRRREIGMGLTDWVWSNKEKSVTSRKRK